MIQTGQQLAQQELDHARPIEQRRCGHLPGSRRGVLSVRINLGCCAGAILRSPSIPLRV